MNLSDVWNLIIHFKENVASEFGKISVKLLKSTSPCILYPLTHIFNLSIL